jgi:hypothetical protein
MMALKANRIFAVLLGLWIALAPAVFAVSATTMPVQTSMSNDARPGACDACPEGDAERGICVLMCLNAALLAITTEPGGMVAGFGAIHQPARHAALRGRLSTPDPAPPKAVSLL